MLIDFAVENFRSFRDRKTLRMIASNSDVLSDNLIDVPDYALRLCRAAAVYGANASGKSNLLEAMGALAALLASPVSRSFLDENDLPPFRLDRDASSRPSRFAVRFLLRGVIYLYEIAARPLLIEEERLTVYRGSRGRVWFERVGQGFTTHKELKGQKARLRDFLTDTTPFLALAAAFSHPQLSGPASWIGRNLVLNQTPATRNRMPPRSPVKSMGQRVHENPDFARWLNRFISQADVGIRQMNVVIREEQVNRSVLRRGTDGVAHTETETVTVPRYELSFIHSGVNDATGEFAFSEESLGTQRLIRLLGTQYDALTGTAGARVVLMDELNESLHPALAELIVSQYQNPSTNPYGSQLIFTTHDTSLLNGSLLRREQVWFTEKDGGGATDLYSLHDFEAVRETGPFETGYLRGRYGAIPFFGPFDFLREAQAPNQGGPVGPRLADPVAG